MHKIGLLTALLLFLIPISGCSISIDIRRPAEGEEKVENQDASVRFLWFQARI